MDKKTEAVMPAHIIEIRKLCSQINSEAGTMFSATCEGMKSQDGESTAICVSVYSRQEFKHVESQQVSWDAAPWEVEALIARLKIYLKEAKAVAQNEVFHQLLDSIRITLRAPGMDKIGKLTTDLEPVTN